MAETQSPIDAGVLDVGGPTLQIVVGTKVYGFEMHPYLGPCPVTNRGAERKLGNRHPFWAAASLWAEQGRQVEDGFCVWRMPPPPKLQHLGGRQYLVIHNSESEGLER